MKLNIPKKTKLFVDQTLRERENCLLMHRVFQHDLYLLRLNTARAFVKSLDESATPVSVDDDEPIKLSAQVLAQALLQRGSATDYVLVSKVLGLGPVFRLVIGLSNTSSVKPSRDLLITFYVDDKLYT